MTYGRRVFLSIIASLMMAAASLLAAGHSPAHIALITHWNYAGLPNGSIGKWVGLAAGPILALMGALPPLPRAVLDGRYDGAARSEGLFIRLWLALLVVAFCTEGAMLTQVLTWPLSPEHLLVVGVGAAIALIGDGLGKSRRMQRAGLRTRSTLASEDSWSIGNRLTGLAMLAAGVIVVIVAGLNARPQILSITLTAALIAIALAALVGSRRAARIPASS